MSSRVRRSGTLCPDCGEFALTRLPSRSLTAVLRKAFTRKRPHLCRKCGWSGWLDASQRQRQSETWTVECEPPDLGSVDAALATPHEIDVMDASVDADPSASRRQTGHG